MKTKLLMIFSTLEIVWSEEKTILPKIEFLPILPKSKNKEFSFIVLRAHIIVFDRSIYR